MIKAAVQKWLPIGLQAVLLAGLALFFVDYLWSGDKDLGLKFLRIANAHEHVQSEAAARRYLEAARRNQITKTLLLGSPEATFIPGKGGFRMEDKNNLELLQLTKRYPGRFIVFAALNPENPDKLAMLEEYVRLGARGVKLYSGHHFFHRAPLDETSMLPVYAYCQSRKLPVVLHVNPALYRDEFENVLRRFPDLKVVCPHFCLSTIRTERFEELMDRYSNLYTDTSFGYLEFMKEAFLRFSKNSRAYRTLVLKYQDRILFGLDLIVTDQDYKTAEWLHGMMRAYRDLLEKDIFYFFALPGVPLRGFGLDLPVLRKIYYQNFERLTGERVLRA